MSETWMNPQRSGLTPVIGDRAIAVQQVQPLQKLYRLRPVGFRRRIEPVKGFGVPGTPLGQRQGQRSQIRLEDFRRGVPGEGLMLGLTPQPVTDAGLNPTRPAFTLFR